MRKLVFAAAAALLSAAAPASAASFIGDAVTIKRIQSGNVFRTVSTNVGATPEYVDNFFRIDINANQIAFSAAGGTFAAGNILYEITGLDFDDNPATANVIEGFTASQIFTGLGRLITADRATITPAGAFRFALNQTTGGASGIATFTLGAAAPIGAVPEPATWAMLIVGFGLVGFMVRSARRRSDLFAAA